MARKRRSLFSTDDLSDEASGDETDKDPTWLGPGGSSKKQKQTPKKKKGKEKHTTMTKTGHQNGHHETPKSSKKEKRESNGRRLSSKKSTPVAAGKTTKVKTPARATPTNATPTATQRKPKPAARHDTPAPRQTQSKNKYPEIKTSRVVLKRVVLSPSYFSRSPSPTSPPPRPRTPMPLPVSMPIVFTSSSSEDEMIQQPRLKKKIKTKLKPTNLRGRGKSAPATPVASTSNAAAPMATSFWRRHSVVSSTSTSLNSNGGTKRKLSNGNANVSSKRRKVELVKDPAPATQAHNGESSRLRTIGLITSSGDEDDERFLSIFKKPISLKPKKSVLDLTMAMSARNGSHSAASEDGEDEFLPPRFPRSLSAPAAPGSIIKSAKRKSTNQKIVQENGLGHSGASFSKANETPISQQKEKKQNHIRELDLNHDGGVLELDQEQLFGAPAEAPGAIQPGTESGEEASDPEVADLLRPIPFRGNVSGLQTTCSWDGIDKDRNSESTTTAEPTTSQPQAGEPQKTGAGRKVQHKRKWFRYNGNDADDEDTQKKTGKDKRVSSTNINSEIDTDAGQIASSPPAAAVKEIKTQGTESKHHKQSQAESTAPELHTVGCGTDPAPAVTEKGTDASILPLLLVDEETNTIRTSFCDQGVDPIPRDTTDRASVTDAPEHEVKSTQTDDESWQQWKAVASTSASTGENPHNSTMETQTDSGFKQPLERNGNGPSSPDAEPELRGTELPGHVDPDQYMTTQRLEEGVVLAAVDSDLVEYRTLTNADLQSEIMTFGASEMLRHVCAISSRDVDGWEEVYPSVRMCAFNPNLANGGADVDGERQMVGFIVIGPKTIRPYEETTAVGRFMFICIEGSVVFKTNQVTNNARGEQCVTPIPLQTGGCIVIGSGIPYSFENRTTRSAKLVYYMYNF